MKERFYILNYLTSLFLERYIHVCVCVCVYIVVKNLPANAGDRKHVGSIPGSGRSPGRGQGNPLQYSFLA